MSRIGKKIIIVPEGVKVEFSPATQSQQEIKVTGPKGELTCLLSDAVQFQMKGNEITVKLDPKFSKMVAMWGTGRSLLANMIEGVVKGFEKKLELQGTGYKMNVQGETLVLEVGFSHSVKIEAPKGIKFEIEKNILTVTGIDKQLVGEITARIRQVRKVEPYKGKGLRYVGEIVRRKEGKKSTSE